MNTVQKGVRILILVVLCFFLQCTVLRRIALASISPNLLLILPAALGYLGGCRQGMFAGFFCGLLTDLYYGSFFGLFALIFLYIGYANGHFRSVYYEDTIGLPMLFIVISDVLYGILFYVLFFLLRGRLHFWHYLMHVILPEAVYTLLLAFPVFLLLRLMVEKWDAGSTRGIESIAS